MIRKLLEKRGIYLTNEEFAAVMEITTEDIRFNRIGFKKCTKLEYVLDVVVRSSIVFRKCA